MKSYIVLSIAVQKFSKGMIVMFESIQLDRDSTKHLYLQLYIQISALIKNGKIKPHTKLPTIRNFSKSLEVNNVTVVSAYKLLEEENLIYKKVGSGSFVAPINQIQEKEEVDLDEDVYIDEDSKFIKEQEEEITKSKVINFATATPTPDLFPIETFKKLLNLVLDRDKGYAFGYQKSQGYLPLRESLSGYVKRYNIEASAENIQIISGAQQGIDILAKTFLDYGDTVFIEEPTYPGAISVFKSRKAKIVDIPMDEDGISILKLEEKLAEERPKLLYLMPNFQNPTGNTYSQVKKKKVLELAKKYDVLIIEDDCLSDLNYGQGKNNSLKSLDDEGRVIYIKSFSKMFMPGLRLAFLIIPPRYLKDILLSKYMSDIFTDGLMQRVLDLYFRQEVWERQLNMLKDTYQERYETMINALKQYLPQEVSFVPPGGGLNIWLDLPKELSAKKLHDKALEAGIKIAPGIVFYHNNIVDNKIRLSIAAVSCHEITEGVKRLAKLIREELKREEDYSWDSNFMPLV